MATLGRCNKLMTLRPAEDKLRAALARALKFRDAALLCLAGTEQWQFLRYYVSLRLDVLRGRRTTHQPLGLGFRWRQWQYEQYMRRIKQREWVS